MSPSPAMRKVMGLAHMEGVYGKRGITKLLSVSSQAEAILTDAQKSILGSFSCCLVPPQDLSDPVRAGQAETSEKSLELVRNVRRIPEAAWPVARERILQRADEITQIVSAGATAEKKSAVRERVGKAIDRARSLSDVEFEVEKNELARAVKIAVQPPQGDAPHKAAYFLLVPGASKVYAQYLQRLAKQDKAAAQTQ
jgi:hypothetical protein